MLAFLQCLLLLTMLLLRPASNDADQWQGSFASWEDASKQLQANELEWAPPGAFAAALSTFKATLQDVTHSTNGLQKVCSSIQCLWPLTSPRHLAMQSKMHVP